MEIDRSADVFSLVQFLLAVLLLLFFTLRGLYAAREPVRNGGVQFADRMIAVTLFVIGALAFLSVDYWMA